VASLELPERPQEQRSLDLEADPQVAVRHAGSVARVMLPEDARASVAQIERER